VGVEAVDDVFGGKYGMMCRVNEESIYRQCNQPIDHRPGDEIPETFGWDMGKARWRVRGVE